MVDKNRIGFLIQKLSDANDQISIAYRYKDARKRDKQIREAKSKAIEMLQFYKPEIRELCGYENPQCYDDLFSWGFLEQDIQKTCEILKSRLETDAG